MCRFRRLLPLVLIGLLVLLRPLVGADDDPSSYGKKASEWVQVLQKDSDAKQRRRAVIALASVGTKVPELVTPALAAALRNDTEAEVRHTAAKGLRSMGPAAVDAMSALAEALKDDKNGDVRQVSAIALGRLVKSTKPEDVRPVKPAIPVLIMALKDAHAGTRAAVAETLGRCGPEAVEATVPLLNMVAKDSDRATRSYAALALVRIDAAADTVVPSLTDVLGKEDTPPELRETIADVLAEYGPKATGAVSALADALKDKSAAVRGKAAVALGKVGPEAKRAVPALRAALKDSDKSVRGFAIRTLGNLGKDAAEAIPDLVKAVTDDNLEVRLAAIEELGQLGSAAQEAVPELRKAAQDGRPAVSKAAKEALRKIQE